MSILSRLDQMMVYDKYLLIPEATYVLRLNKEIRKTFRDHWILLLKNHLRDKYEVKESTHPLSLQSSFSIFIDFRYSEAHWDYAKLLISHLQTRSTNDSEYGCTLEDITILVYLYNLKHFDAEIQMDKRIDLLIIGGASLNELEQADLNRENISISSF